MSPKVAVVTGGNKGIGYAIVRALCKQLPGYDVLLTARDEARGREAVERLQREDSVSPKFFALDITSADSVACLKRHLADTYGGLDVLVNNAGIAYKVASTAPFAEQAEVTMATNFTATLNVCNELFPLLRSGARVVHLSSRASTMSLSKCSQQVHTRFADMTSLETLEKEMALFVAVVHLSSRCSTIGLGKCSEQVRQKFCAMSDIAQVVTEMAAYVQAAKAGTHEQQGYAPSAYGMSKVGVTVMTGLQQQAIAADTSRTDILVNSCCPGYVATDMSSFKGHLTIDQGAETPVWLATLPPGTTEPRGDFCAERKVLNWRTMKGWQ